MNGIYEPFRAACAKRGTNISTALRAIGHSDGVTGGWKKGQYPRLDIAMELSQYLEVSLDELCYGEENSAARVLTSDEIEWLSLFSRVEPSRREMCMDFIKTHIAVPEKYLNKEKASS